MKDIGIELYEAISAEFQRALSADKIIGGIMQRIETGKAQSTDIARYANRLGQMLRTAIERNVSADKLPDGQMYYNIAEKILRPSLKNTYDLFNDTAAEIQAVVDQALGINIKAQKPEFPDERIDDVIGAASVKGIPEEQMIRRLASPAENITQNYADDYAKVNADFRSRAGLSEYIIRRDDGNCCEWCGKLAGKYRYPDEVPKDVYRRHDNCGCTTEHFSDGTKTDVWSKKSSTISAEDRERMAQLSENRFTGFTPEEAVAKEAEVKAQIKDRFEPEEGERLEKELREKQKSLLPGNKSAKSNESAFVPAKTLEEAQNYAKQYCKESFMAKNFKGGVDFKGISVENANAINKALYETYSKVELEKLSGIKTVSPTSALGKKAFKDGADAVFAYDPIQHGIYVNKEVLKNQKTFAEYVKRSEDSWNIVMNNIDKLTGSQKELALTYKNAGRSLVDGDTVEGLFTHELGHHAQWTLLDAKTNNSVGDRMKEYAPKISGYANASKSEYLAESFVAYMRGETDILDPEYVRFINSKSI